MSNFSKVNVCLDFRIKRVTQVLPFLLNYIYMKFLKRTHQTTFLFIRNNERNG